MEPGLLERKIGTNFPIFYNEKTGPLKDELFSSLRKLNNGNGIRILEFGAGSGANMEYYPENTKLTVVEPNPFFKEHLESTLKKFPQVELERYLITGAEDMKDIPDHSVDAVVSTLVLCSANDLQGIYKEIRRVLVPGGKYFFMEHVIDPLSSLLKMTQVILGSFGVFQFFLDGCRPDKDIKRELEKGGFARVDAKPFRLNLKGGVPLDFALLYLIEPHIYGTATTALQ
ncbi:unnamed protein product [Orchesella dallaii]|uniref:Methyltransferase type 11 domain-containing protein n=1 Tax=Orchesella dallaii TaxID=48710 RepID=A0ABP1R0L4_9HEXA